MMSNRGAVGSREHDGLGIKGCPTPGAAGPTKHTDTLTSSIHLPGTRADAPALHATVNARCDLIMCLSNPGRFWQLDRQVLSGISHHSLDGAPPKPVGLTRDFAKIGSLAQHRLIAHHRCDSRGRVDRCCLPNRREICARGLRPAGAIAVLSGVFLRRD